MTEDERIPTCSDHRWSAPQPRLVENNAGELVEHPTQKMRFCAHCPAEESLEKEPK